MTVAENMAFGLRLAGMSRREIDAAVARAAQILQIEHLLERKPKALSGGQRQRVAIGRAIVRKPGVFLFDEPLSNLDAALRVQMRVELARLHRELNTTMVYVTHDQVEAMTLANRIVVLNAGRVEQVGSPLELYKNPRNLFVAGFIGSPTMNFVSTELVARSESGARVRLAQGAEVEVAVSAHGLALGARLTLGVRPEHLVLGTDSKIPDATPRASVVAVEHLGDTTYVHLTLPSGETWMVRTDADHSPPRGTQLALQIPARKAHLFDDQGLALSHLS
jgi:multiple sugar transport system ATP-binding protein